MMIIVLGCKQRLLLHWEIILTTGEYFQSDVILINQKQKMGSLLSSNFDHNDCYCNFNLTLHRSQR